jgi:methyl-accepting chemotaxis protein
MNSALPEVAQGVQLTGGTADSLRTIENSTRRILSRIGEVAHATHEQSEASVAISQQVQQIATMVEETTGIIRSSSEASSQLKTIAENIKRQVEKFRLQESMSF